MLYLPDDVAVCAVAKILWEFQNPEWVAAQTAKRADKWARTPAQEACRELAARIRSGR